MPTNIKDEHKRALDLLGCLNPNIALVSCFVDGKPTSAIAHVTRIDAGSFHIEPLFIFPAEGMTLTDHDGVPVSIDEEDVIEVGAVEVR